MIETIVGTLVVVAIITVILFWSRSKQEGKEAAQPEVFAVEIDKKEHELFDMEMNKYKTTPLEQIPTINDMVDDVIFDSGEKCYEELLAWHIAIGKSTKHVGSSRGVSFRIPGMPKGLNPRIYLGHYEGHSEGESTMEVADTGNLYVTDRRVIFSGPNGIIGIPLKEVASVKCDGGLVMIFQEHHGVPMMFLMLLETDALLVQYLAIRFALVARSS